MWTKFYKCRVWWGAGRESQIFFSPHFRGNKDKEAYRHQKRATQRAIRAAHWRHVNTILDDSLKQGNSKPFWRYIKSRRVDNIGVSGLKDKGMFFEDSKSKAELLLKQFSSVFTIENKDDLLPNINFKFPSINNLVIDERGVLLLIKNLNVNKAVGPDADLPTIMIFRILVRLFTAKYELRKYL